MSKFKRKKKKDEVRISTASLPDIVFMLLFFFMVVTVIRQKEIMVKIHLPQATEVTKLEDPRKTDHIYIGPPRNTRQQNAAAVIQINDKFVKKERVAASIAKDKGETVALQVDKGVTMGVVTDVKLEMRKAERLKVHYIAHQENRE